MGSIPKQHLNQYLKLARTSKECNKVPYMNVMKSRFNDNLKLALYECKECNYLPIVIATTNTRQQQYYCDGFKPLQMLN